LTEHLADELIRVPRTAQDPCGFLVRSRRRRGGHTGSIRSRSQAGGIAIAESRLAFGATRAKLGGPRCRRGRAPAATSSRRRRR
jgi:hypothetical protein